MGLVAYVERLKGTAKLRPDNKLVISRAWGDPQGRLNGLVQLTKGLSSIARRAAKKAACAQTRPRTGGMRMLLQTIVYCKCQPASAAMSARQRPGAQKALEQVDALVGQNRQLRFGLHPSATTLSESARAMATMAARSPGRGDRGPRRARANDRS
jgi:hypothetical protein